MIRNVDMNEISDGRLYNANDKVRCGTHDCANCHKIDCCTVTEDTIVLDPYDAALLCAGLECNFDALMERIVGLRPVDGLILPYLKKRSVSSSQNDATSQDNAMQHIEDTRAAEACVFLDESGRCQIHAIRPGICRLFPLGRIYDGEKKDFAYFLQIHECPKLDPDTIAAEGYPLPENVRVKDWLGIENLEEYEQFVKDWHFLTKDLEEVMHAHPEEEFVKKLCMAVLNLFFRRPYGQSGAESFFAEFDARVAQMREIITL